MDLKIPVGYFDLKDQENFKKINSIKQIPVIMLIINGIEVTFHGIVDKKHLINWIFEKTKLKKIPFLQTKEEFET